MPMPRAALALVLGLSLGACAGPVASPTPAPSASPTPAPTATEIAVLEWPTDSAVALAPGRYSSSPPFDVPFTIDIPDDGWGSAHLHGDFFDFMNVTEIGAQPTRWVAFAHPQMLYGADAVSADDLSPRAAAELLAGLDDVDAGPVSDAMLLGIAGAQVDLTTSFPNVHLFGGPAGQFGMDPAYALRLVVLPHETDGDLLLVLVLAPPDELESAWTEVQPILATVQL